MFIGVNTQYTLRQHRTERYYALSMTKSAAYKADMEFYAYGGQKCVGGMFGT